jgi:hypothetical protein
LIGWNALHLLGLFAFNKNIMAIIKSQVIVLSEIEVCDNIVLGNNGNLLTYEEIDYLKHQISITESLYAKEKITNSDIVETNSYLNKRQLENTLLNNKKHIQSINNRGIIYLLINNQNFLYKIGITKNIIKRLSQIKSASGFDISVVHYHSDIIQYTDIELEMHKYWKDKRKIGEWFDLSKDDVLIFKNWFNIKNK